MNDILLELFENPPSCPACHGSGPEVLGTLGNVAWGRCRDCGADFQLREEAAE